MSADKRMRAAELAVDLGVTRETILEWARIGRIPCARLTSRTVFFDRAKCYAALGLEVDTTAAAK